MLYITEDQVRQTLTMAQALRLVERSFRQFADGSAVNHPRKRLILPGGSILHYMAGGDTEYFGIKVYSSNPKTGAHFTFLLYRTSDGMPLANIEANHMGQIRTGAASGVATKYLARQEADVLGVIGSGFQALTQVDAIARVRRLREVRVWSRNAERRSEFARKCFEKSGVNARATDTAQDAVEGAGIVVTATGAKEPVLDSAWISPGTHINAMGSNWTIKRELPSDLILDKASLVTVDSVEDGRLESGDLVIPMNERPGIEFPASEFSEVVSGRKPGRTSPDQITIFKSNGLAIQDVAVGGFLYESLK